LVENKICLVIVLDSEHFFVVLLAATLSISQARLRRPMDWVLSRIDELMGHVMAADRPALYQAIWGELAEEMATIRKSHEA
jgi:hypothetical protein